MTKKKTVLLIEDDVAISVVITDGLTLHYDVIVAPTGEIGLEMAGDILPDIIILDWGLPRMSGSEVCIALKSSPQTKNIPVLMLTVMDEAVKGLDFGADDYLRKPYDPEELAARIRALLRRMPRSPFDESIDGCTLSLTIEYKSRIGISVHGKLSNNLRTSQIVTLDVPRYTYKGDSIQLPQWQQYAENVGRELFDELIGSQKEVLSSYGQALGAVGGQHSKLHIRLAASRDLLGVPLECLHNSATHRFLSLLHPLTRQLTNVTTNNKSITPNFLNNLAGRDEKLKILLIGSNTAPYQLGFVPGADREIATLGQLLIPMFSDVGLKVHLDVLPTERASYENVKRILKDCKYNVIHYAGHCTYHSASPENSSLFFWEKEGRGGEAKRVSISELESWLRNSKVNFAYLSCCSGAQAGPLPPPVMDSFIGVAEGIVQAGVPSVLGFRWPLSDAGGVIFATAFYSALSRQGHLDMALLEARNEARLKQPEERTWLSPILISQPD